MTIPARPLLPVEVTSILPDTLPELERELARLRERIVRHRDTSDMRLAQYIEARIADLETTRHRKPDP